VSRWWVLGNGHAFSSSFVAYFFADLFCSGVYSILTFFVGFVFGAFLERGVFEKRMFFKREKEKERKEEERLDRFVLFLLSVSSAYLSIYFLAC
jgi:hypothetical protein